MGRDKGDALRGVTALRMRGGLDATEVLLRVARRGDREARVAALEALGHVGIRTERVLSLLRSRAADALRVPQRAAALEALGRIGGGRDVPILLDGLRAKRGYVRTVAFKALSRLSGEPLPASPTRVAQWWKRHDKQHRKPLYEALDSMRAAVREGREKVVKANSEMILRSGWLDLGAVQEAVEGWLATDVHALRNVGFEVVAALRLGDYANAVQLEAARSGARARCPAAASAQKALGLERRT